MKELLQACAIVALGLGIWIAQAMIVPILIVITLVWVIWVALKMEKTNDQGPTKRRGYTRPTDRDTY